MSLCSAQVTSNANSKLCMIDLVVDATSMTSPERMELLGRIVDDYRRGTDGSIERIRAAKADFDLVMKHYGV